MNFQFYGYSLRTTGEGDLALALAWTRALPGGAALDAGFWLRQGEGRESFVVTEGAEPLAFFQVEHRWRTQVRIHFQSSPAASPKKILSGLTKLVPLSERALALRGVRAVFFTSHSAAMATFMEKRLQYRLAQMDGGADGAVMFKLVGAQQ